MTKPRSPCNWAHTGTYSVAENASVATALRFFSCIYRVLQWQRLYCVFPRRIILKCWTETAALQWPWGCCAVTQLGSEGQLLNSGSGSRQTPTSTAPRWAVRLLLLQFKQPKLAQSNVPTCEEMAHWKWVKLLIMINSALPQGKPANYCTRPYSGNKEGRERRKGVNPCRGEECSVCKQQWFCRGVGCWRGRKVSWKQLNRQKPRKANIKRKVFGRVGQGG